MPLHVDMHKERQPSGISGPHPADFAAYIDALLAKWRLLNVALPPMQVHHCVLEEGASMYDIVIRGGTVVDGTGKVAFTGDVAIAGSQIAAVGGKLGPARREIDATGLLVT